MTKHTDYCGDCDCGIKVLNPETYEDFCKGSCRYMQSTEEIFEMLITYECMFIEILAEIGADGDSYNSEYDHEQVANMLMAIKHLEFEERDTDGSHNELNIESSAESHGKPPQKVAGGGPWGFPPPLPIKPDYS